MEQKPSSFPTLIILVVLLGFIAFRLGWVDAVIQWLNPAQISQQVAEKHAEKPIKHAKEQRPLERPVSKAPTYRKAKPTEPEVEDQCQLNWHNEEAVADAKERLALLNDNLEFEKSQFRLSNYATVNLITPKLSDDYHQTLKTRLSTAYTQYRRFFQVSAPMPYQINLVVLPPQYYRDYISQFGSSSSTNIGVYFGASNTAFVKYNSSYPEQSLTTAVHEALHVFNYRLIGDMPKWLDEGLAEVFENTLRFDSDKVINVPSRYFKERLFMLSVLIDSEGSWQGADTLLMYKNSALWVGFLMQSSRGKQVLKALLQHEATNACIKLSAEQVIHTLIDYYPRYEEAFNNWIKAHLNTEHEFVPIL